MWRPPTPQEQRGVGQDGVQAGECWVVSVGLSSPTCEMGFSERPVCVQMPAQGLAHQGCPDRGTPRQTDRQERDFQINKWLASRLPAPPFSPPHRRSPVQSRSSPSCPAVRGRQPGGPGPGRVPRGLCGRTSPPRPSEAESAGPAPVPWGARVKGSLSRGSSRRLWALEQRGPGLHGGRGREGHGRPAPGQPGRRWVLGTVSLAPPGSPAAGGCPP